MEETTYVIFSEGELVNFHLYPLDDLPDPQREKIKLKVSEFYSRLFVQSLTSKSEIIRLESKHLESISNVFQSTNFFETFHDGRCFPFRGKGTMFVALVHMDDSDLLLVVRRESLLLRVTEKAICEALVKEKILIP